MEAHHSWREFWHRLQHQLQVGLGWMISSLVETLYLVLWVLMQWSFERLLAWLPVSHDSRWELVVLRAIFALSTFIMIMLSIYADVRRAWYEARNLITEPHIPSDTERTQSNGDGLRPLAPLSARFRRTLIAAIYWALLVGIIVGGAGFVGVVTKTIWGVASYLVTLAIATYLVLAHSRLKVPPECVALTKLGHNPRLLWGPLTYYTWPISENLIGIIPLYTLCLDSERFQVIIVDGMLVVRIRLSYRVSTSGDVGVNVLNVAREILDSGQRTGRSLLSLRRTLPVKTSQEALNRRLSADLRNSIFEISLGKTYQALAENLDKTSVLLCGILSEKVEKWGLEIVNVKLLELGMPESAKGI